MIIESSHFVGISLTAYLALQKAGKDPDPVFLSAGIDVRNLSNPDMRLSGHQWGEFWRACIEASDDPLFALQAVENLQPIHFHALGLALFSSRTLRRYFQRLASYYSFLSNAQTVTFDESDEACIFRVVKSASHQNDPWTQDFLILGTLIYVVKMIRLMCRPAYHPVEIRLCQPSQGDLQNTQLEAFFGCPVIYDQSANELVCDLVDLDEQLPAANAALAQLNDKMTLDLMARMTKADVPNRVRACLLEKLPTGEFNKGQVAKALNFSVRSLHNKLVDAGTSYQEILDDTRRLLAEQYLRQVAYSVGDVAFLLGFSDFSNFSRAFKRWTGETPTDYRAHHLGHDPLLETNDQ